MASLLLEEALAGGEALEAGALSEETAVKGFAEPEEEEEVGGNFNYSGGGAGGARYEPYEYYNYGPDNMLIGFERYGTPEGFVSDFRGGRGFENLRNPESGFSSAFRQDRAPQGAFQRLLGRQPRAHDAYYASFVADKANQGVGAIYGLINDIYDVYRTDKKLDRQGAQNTTDRYKIGIVFKGKENRDDLIKRNKIPAYYSTSNIKSLLRRGIMPFGWNSEMAVEQGFGQEIYVQEMKKVSDEKAKKFLHREKN